MYCCVNIIDTNKLFLHVSQQACTNIYKCKYQALCKFSYTDNRPTTSYSYTVIWKIIQITNPSLKLINNNNALGVVTYTYWCYKVLKTNLTNGKTSTLVSPSARSSSWTVMITTRCNIKSFVRFLEQLHLCDLNLFSGCSCINIIKQSHDFFSGQNYQVTNDYEL